MKIRRVMLASASALLFVHGLATAQVTSGTATRVGEPLEADSTVGRSQIKVCGKLAANPVDVRACTFTLAQDSPIEIVNEGAIFDTLFNRAGGSVNAATFQTSGPGRPALNAKFTDKNNGTVDFCFTIDRAITIAPDGISTEPCVDGDTTSLTTAFTLDCDDGVHEFSEENTWRVAAHCNANFPNLRIIQ